MQVSCGGNQTAVIMNTGELFTWGEGQFGATGLGTQQNVFAPTKVELNSSSFLQVSCGKRHTLAIDIHGGVYITGDNQYRQLGISGINEIMQFQKLNEFGYPAK